MALKKISNKSPRQILQDHFEAHQQQQQYDHSAKSRKSQLSVPARVRLIQLELETHTLTTALGNVSLKDRTHSKTLSSSSTENNDYKQEIADTLLHVCHAAMATVANAESQTAVDAILELATALSVHLRLNDGDDDSPMLATLLLPRVLDLSSVLAERVRAQACHWLGYCVREVVAVLVQEQEDAMQWAEDCLDEMQTVLLTRLLDKSQLVRHAAIRACANFFESNQDDEDQHSKTFNPQDTRNENVLQALLWSCASDSSFANRIQAIISLPFHKTAVEHIIYRVRDVHAKVRVQALDSLQQMARSMPTILNPHQCAEIVHAGLTDRCSSTKQAASKLICAGWMKAFKYNPLALLKHMDVSAHEQSCEKALLVIFEAADQASNSPLLSGLSRSERQAFSAGVFNAIISIQSDDHTDDDMSETPFTLLDGEAVFFSRVACQRALETKTLSSVKKAQVVAQVVPDITVLCQVLQSHLMWITSQHSITAEQGTDEVATFVCSQLLQLAKMSDLQEEGSRRHFSTFMRQVLGSMDTPYDLIEGCLKAWKDASEHEADFLHDVSAILETLSGHNQVNGETDEEFDCLLRILLILSVVLETRSSTTPDFAGIGFEKYIVPAVTHANNSVREAGVSCFGKLGLYTDQESRLAEFKPLLLRVASRQEEKLEVRAQALLALCDWVLIFPDMLTPCDIDGSEVSLMSIVTGLLHHARSGGVAVAAEVAVKLLFSGKFCDSETIAELMILFFDELPKTSSPHDDDDDINQVGSPERLQQLLSVFFPAYATTSPTGRDALLGSIGPLLIKANIRQAKSNQNAKATNVVNMVNYICSTVGQVMAQENVTAENTTLICLADTGEDAPEVTKSPPAAPGVHMSASIQISQFLVNAGEDVRTTMLRSLCKLLGSMSMSIATSEDHQALLLLKNCNEELGMIITDPTSLRSLTALNEALADVAIDDEADNAGGARNEIVDEETEDDDDDDNDVAGEETEEEENASLSDDIPDDASGETLVNGMRSVFISSNANKENPVSSSVAFKHEKPNKERAPRACRAQGNCQGSK